MRYLNRTNLSIAAVLFFILSFAIGIPNPSFNPQDSSPGKMIWEFNPSGTVLDFFATSAAVDAEGRIVVVGRAGGQQESVLTARFTASGALDTSFNSPTGYRLSGYASGAEAALDVTVLPNGEIVIPFSHETNTSFDLDEKVTHTTLLRLSASGAEISKAYINLPYDVSRPLQVLRDSNGKLLILGQVYTGLTGQGTGWDFFVARLLPDLSSLDPTFGDSGSGGARAGIIRWDYNLTASHRDLAYRMALATDGQILVLTSSCDDLNCTSLTPNLYRLNSDGTIDTSFGDEGSVDLDFIYIPLKFDETNTADVTVDPSGRIYLIASSNITGTNPDYRRFRIIALKPNGDLDTSYGTGGVASSNFHSSTGFYYEQSYAHTAVLDGNGKLVVAGITDGYPNHKYIYGYTRFTAAGGIDLFNGNRVQEVAQLFSWAVRRVLVKPNNEILLVGQAYRTESSPTALGIFSVIAPNDECPLDPNKSTPGVCDCGTPDTDSNNNGTIDCQEAPDECVNDPAKTAPGICGCGIPDVDTNQNGLVDCRDPVVESLNLNAPGVTMRNRKILVKMDSIEGVTYQLRVISMRGTTKLKTKTVDSDFQEIEISKPSKATNLKISYRVVLPGTPVRVSPFSRSKNVSMNKR